MSDVSNNFFAFGSFRFYPRSKTLWNGETLVALSPKATSLLELLLERHGHVVSKQEIFDHVWPGTFVEDGVLTQNIYTLRQAVGTDENGKHLIENIARRGYRIAAPVTLVSEAEAPPVEPTAETDIPKYAATPFKTRKLLAIAAVAVLVVAAVVIVGYQFRGSISVPEPVSRTGELQFKQLTDTGDASYMTISQDGKLVAHNRGNRLFLRDLTSNVEREIPVENTLSLGCLQFSPDNSFIYFGNLTQRDEKGVISRIPAAGGTVERMVENVWSGFSFSPAGTEMAFVRKLPTENKQALVIRNVASGEERTVATIDLPEEFYWNNYPAWSQDGKTLAMVVVNQTEHLTRMLFIETAGGQKELKLPFRNMEQVIWTRDGQSVIGVANDGTNFQLWRISLADGSRKKVTNDLSSYLGISVSQDGTKMVARQRIYYSNLWLSKKDSLAELKQITTGTSRNDGLSGLTWLDDERIVYATNDEKIRDWNISVLNINDNSRVRLTNDTETQNDSPSVSPDRQWIYFSSDRNKQSRIWRVRTDGSELKQVTYGEDETHHFPQISPDGHWLYFIIKSGRTSTIGRRSLLDNSTQELSGATKYVPGNFLSLTRDGKTLAFQNIAFEGRNAAGTPKIQIGFLSTDNPDQITFTEIESWRKMIQWTEDSTSFAFVGGDIKNSSIVERSVASETPSTPLIPQNASTIFNFAWSPNRENFAASRGQLSRDVVLLTGFQ